MTSTICLIASKKFFKLSETCSTIPRACEGVIFKSIELANEVMSRTETSAGLKVFTSVLDQVFRTGRKAADGFKENMKIKFDEFLPKWNYVAVPSGRN